MIAALALCLAPSLAFAAGTPPSTCGPPTDLHDGWQTAAPAQEGLDPTTTCAISPALEKIWYVAHPNGVIVVRHGALVYEHYFAGYFAGDMHAMNSITKSVVALLAGIAFDRGWLTNLNAPVFSFFPEYPDLRTSDKDQISLRDLLTMTSGLNWPEGAIAYGGPSNIFDRMWLTPDPYRFVLARPLVAPPGTKWNYNSGGVELLGNILMKVSHQRLDRFAQQALFDPLEFRNWMWTRMANGKSPASAGLYVRLRDLAKIGQLVLNQGAWHGRQIVSAQWIKAMTGKHASVYGYVHNANSYGYLWWRGRSKVADREIGWVGGVGYDGQRLYVVPSEDLVVAVTAGIHPDDVAGNVALDMALRGAVEHGPDATASLKRLIQSRSGIIRAGRQ